MTAKTYDRQTAKFLAVVGENMPELSGDVMQGWIQNPRALQKALSKAFCPPFKVWKTIKLGTGLINTAEDFRRVLRDGKFRLSNQASDILRKSAFTVATKETEIDLVKVTVGELGFNKLNTYQYNQIYKRAKKLGLELCPPEVGPQLRLQYQDQPSGEWIFVAMEPIIDSAGFLELFCMRRLDSKLCLYSQCLHHSHLKFSGPFWSTESRWVFCRSRN